MKLEGIIFVLCSFALMRKTKAGGTMGPMGKIILNSVYECKDELKPKGDDVKIKLNLRQVDDKDDKVLDMEYVSKIDLNDTMNYAIDIKKFENGNWKPFYNVKGIPCRDFNRYLKKLWTKLTSALEPKPEKNCPIPAGTYKLHGFHALTSDIEIKAMFYGKLMATISITDKSGKVVFCGTAEGVHQAP